MSEGYSRVQRRIRTDHRTLCYVIAKPYLKNEHTTIYEFMPLEGDPSPEEIVKIQQENFEKEMEDMRRMKNQMMDRFNNINNGGV